ncbi:discoidin domain-containing protein, partial [Streptomyces massasporeus]
AALVVTVLAFTAYAWLGLRREHPLLDPALFGIRGFRAGAIVVLVQFMAVFGFFFVGLQYLQLILGYSPLKAAAALVPVAVVVLPTSQATPHLVRRVGMKATMTVGLLLLSAGLFVISRLDVGSGYLPFLGAGTYRVPVSFAGEERVLTVRAFPRTAGPDLARTATASSSGDETPDFPAALAVDGDPATRWSSPAEDGAWWQLELPEPARIGQVVLHWQDAYASRYRVQVSADGRVWRTAATVAEGRGGRESVRMDAADTRFLRVQGDARATQYGYSLWSVDRGSSPAGWRCSTTC